MKNENNFNMNYEANSCTSRGVCSISPNIAALQELIIFFMKESAHYLLELHKLGASNNKINLNIINNIASLISVNEYSESQMYDMVMDDYFLLKNIKDTYYEMCKKNNIVPIELESDIYYNEQVTISKAISLGEKLFLTNYKRHSLILKNLIEILMIMIKTTGIHLAKLYEFGIFDDEKYNFILKCLDELNKKQPDESTIKSKINELAIINNKLQIQLCELIFDKFGTIAKVNISRSTERGKAILVSGDNFFDLKNILEKTIDKDIDIYTHSNLLIAHTLQEFRKYKHLKGHYGDTTQSCLLDFATFPGAILMTKTSKSITDYLYRGRLFSTDFTVPVGVVKIENNNFDEVIRASQEAKGFKKGKLKSEISAGYNEQEIEQKFEKISNALKSGKLSRLFIIGMDSYSETRKEYYRQIFSNMKKDEFAISFYYESQNKNVLTINLGNYQPFATNILFNYFAKYYPIDSENLTFFFTTCTITSLSDILIHKEFGAKNIYMENCPSSILNPTAFENFTKEYNIKLTSDAFTDLKNIRTKK